MASRGAAIVSIGAVLLGGTALGGCIPPAREYGPAIEQPRRALPPEQPRAQREPRPEPQRSGRPVIDAPVIDANVRALPAPPPAWVARPVTPDAKLISAFTYVVQRGDTLSSIANKTGASAEAIARANGVTSPHSISTGQRLTIPGGRYHLIRAGESGIAIARAYNVAWSSVVAANMLEEPYILRTGQRLLIPGPGPETLEERAARFHIDIDDILTGGEPALAEKAVPAKPIASSARVLPATTPVAAPSSRAPSQFVWPVSGPLVKRFGPGKSGERNDGIKIAVPLDTPVRAAADGVVAYVGSDVPALGGLVIVKHGNGLTTVYGHAGQLLVQRGQAVKRGQTIARSGKTGFADRPELHFEIRQGRTPLDPLTKLPAR
ncbi:MAG: M23 family metallopeptidase [Sphingomonas sp.]|uniref:M23 family metallopeptidase n=1 Tax=Sphingomonas sp. TaxID=28214 RepID=UPI001B0EDA05|nr:M23 family metallopeptidase [Sphingomonas sp.]MBO9622903.1 M23 family metallopeptidase [Sphingomonas sp.]